MPRILKWTVTGLAAVLALAVLLGIALKVVFDTEAGTRWAIARANTALPGTIDAPDFDGTLWRGLDFPQLHYRDPERELEATRLRLKINWTTLAAGQLTLETIGADEVIYRDHAAPPAVPMPFELSMPALPVAVSIDAVEIPRLAYAKQGQTLEFLNTVVRNVHIEDQSVRIRSLSAIFSDTALSATRVRATLAGEVPTSADIAWRRMDDSWSGSGSIAESLTNLRFRQSIAGPYPATVSGTLQVLHKVEPEFNASVRWDRWAFGDAELSSGTLQASGVAENYMANYDVTVTLLDAQTLQVSGTAQGDTAQLSSFTTDIESPDANAELTGSLSWAPAFFVEAQVHASEINLGAFVAELSGNLAADASLSIDADNTVTISNLSVTGLLNDQAAQATGNLVWAAEKMQCRACVIQVGSNLLKIEGDTAGDIIALSLQIDAPNLAELWPGLSGAATLDADLGGTSSSPHFSGDLSAQMLGFDEWFVDELQVHSSESDLDIVNVSATVVSLRRGDAEFGSLELIGEGRWQQLLVHLDWAVGGAVIRAKSEIRRADEVINGTLSSAQITEANSGDWRLLQPFEFEVAGNNVSVAAHEWAGDNGGLQVQRFATTADEVSLAARLLDVPLSLANPWLPQHLTLLGSASADIELTQQSGLWSGTIAWRQSKTVVQVAERDDQLTNVSVPRAELQAELRDGGVVAKAWLSIEPGINGQLDLELARFARDTPLRAKIALQGEQWEWISAVFPEIDAFKGTILADVTADGPLNAPEFSGNVSWRDGGLLIPAMNVPLEKIEIVVSGASNGTAVLAGSAKAGDGKLAVDGRFEQLTLPTRSVQINLSGAEAALINWPEYQLWATPDLTITGNADGWQFAGQVEVPRANFIIPEIPDGAVRVSEDVTILGNEEPTRQVTRVSGETHLLLGEEVHIAALGLDTGLQGDLLLRMPADKSMTAEGRVTLIDGIFAAYGQKLTIREGSTLTFTGPLDDPLVDVKAIRVIETFEGQVTAGIHLRGRAQNLTSTVFSEPSMADADALSYLVIGRPLNQATESEGGELSGAAVALGLRQATRLIEQIGQTIGLDQLSLTGDGGDTTALVAGKQLNSRLYARYAYGVFSRLGTLLVQYKLSRRLALEAGAGENQSIDVLYSVEKD